MNQPIHVAVTRKIKPGCEAEFQSALKDFFKNSFENDGVHGAGMLLPPPGSQSREIGILRTFANAQQRDEFYASPLFQAWEKRIEPLIDGKPEYRELNGLEAWFRSPQNPPPIWKMAVLTWIAVWPVSMAVPAAFNPLMGQRMPNVIFAGIVAAGIVVVLTWIAMPLLVRIMKPWLHSK